MPRHYRASDPGVLTSADIVLHNLSNLFAAIAEAECAPTCLTAKTRRDTQAQSDMPSLQQRDATLERPLAHHSPSLCETVPLLCWAVAGLMALNTAALAQGRDLAPKTPEPPPLESLTPQEWRAVHRDCGQEWDELKKLGKTTGLLWKDFFKACRARHPTSQR